MRRPGPLAFLLLALALSWPPGTVLAQPGAAPSAPPPGFAGRELVIGTKDAPPFAMKNAEGQWQGISIDLWRHVAEGMKLRYRFEEMPTVQALVDAVAAGRVDAGVAAITVTAARKRVIDFTQPFYATGLGVAVPSEGVTAWLPVLRTFLSFSFLQAVLALLGIALAVGILVWLFERRHNKPYGGGAVRGLTAGVWWSAVAMTQAGAAQDGPVTTPGRILATVWMIASVVTIAVFIAGISSALTTQRLQGLVRNVNDLRGMRVGVVEGSSAAEFLTAQRVSWRGFPGPREGLAAVQKHQIDAFVHDRPLLSWTIRQDYSSLQLLGINLDVQNYAVALPEDNALRRSLDVALLDSLRGEWWQQTLFRYLGSSEMESAGR
jgi:ABC-type amino acid transport substrate-binding protein